MEEKYYGPRDNTFKNLIISILKKGEVGDRNIEILTSEKCMKYYSNALTSDSIDPNDNYQVFEQLGDITCNKFIVWYMYRRFPFLKCPAGVKIVARLRINYGAKQSFFNIGKSLGLWDFVSASIEERSTRMKALLEDVFEALIGSIEYTIDEENIIGTGEAIVYKILKNIFDNINISLAYEDLYDAKTRLKELFDYHASQIGTFKIELTRENFNVTATVYKIKGSNKEKLSYYTSHSQSVSEQEASRIAISVLNSHGIYKKVNEIYDKISKK